MKIKFHQIMFSSLTRFNIQNFSIFFSTNVVSAELAISISSLIIRVIAQECSIYFKFKLGIRVGMKVNRMQVCVWIKILLLCISTDIHRIYIFFWNAFLSFSYKATIRIDIREIFKVTFGKKHIYTSFSSFV